LNPQELAKKWMQPFDENDWNIFSGALPFLHFGGGSAPLITTFADDQHSWIVVAARQGVHIDNSQIATHPAVKESIGCWVWLPQLCPQEFAMEMETIIVGLAGMLSGVLGQPNADHPAVVEFIKSLGFFERAW
jgi:hypothetical protein